MVDAYVRYHKEILEIYLDPYYKNRHILLKGDEIVAINKRQIEKDDYNTLSIFYKDPHIINNIKEIRLKATCRTECEGYIRMLRASFALTSFEFKVGHHELKLNEYLSGFKKFPKDFFILLQMLEYLRNKQLKQKGFYCLKSKFYVFKENDINNSIATEKNVLIPNKDSDKKLENMRYLDEEALKATVEVYFMLN